MPDSALAAPAPALPRRAGAGGGVLRVRVATLVRLVLLLSIVGQLGRIPVLQAGKKDAPILLNDLVLAVLLCAGAAAVIRARRLGVDRVAFAALAWAAVGAGSAVLAVPRFGLTGKELVFSLAYVVRWLAYFLVYLVTINFVRREDVPSVWRAFSHAIVAFAAFGIFQALFLPGFAQMVYPDSTVYLDWDYQGHRLVSTVLDPNFAGALVNMALLPSLALLAYGVRQSPAKLAVLFGALALTLSRGAIVAFLAGVLVILAGRGLSRRLLRVAALLPLAVLPLLPFLVKYASTYNKLTLGDRSALGRVAGWLLAIKYFAKNPVIGVGFNTFGFVQARMDRGLGAVLSRSSFGMDGGLLQVAALTGLVGLALYLWMLGAAFGNARRSWRDTEAAPETRGLALGVAAVTVCIVVHGFFLNTLFYPFIMEPLWILWGLVFVARPRTAPAAAPPVRGVVLAQPGAFAAPAPSSARPALSHG